MLSKIIKSFKNSLRISTIFFPNLLFILILAVFNVFQVFEGKFILIHLENLVSRAGPKTEIYTRGGARPNTILRLKCNEYKLVY